MVPPRCMDTLMSLYMDPDPNPNLITSLVPCMGQKPQVGPVLDQNPPKYILSGPGYSWP